MDNGHIEIHDPFSNHNASPDLKSTSDSPSMEDTVEYRIMMAYAKRRRPKRETSPSPRGSHVGLNGVVANGTVGPEKEETTTEEKPKKKKRKMKGLKALLNIFKCVRSQTEDEEPQQTPDDDNNVSCRLFSPHDETEENEDESGDVAERLMELAEEMQFIPVESDIEADCEHDDVEKIIGLILRESGDSLNERELKNANIAMELFWNYDFFNRLMSSLLTRMGLKSSNPDSPGPKASPKTQMAVMCEVTSRLSAVNTLPMNRLLDHGARYLQDYYSHWAEQQGGYEAAFQEDEDEVQ